MLSGCDSILVFILYNILESHVSGIIKRDKMKATTTIKKGKFIASIFLQPYNILNVAHVVATFPCY